MEPNNTEEQFFGAESLLAEPHFDEEATLLSARPVVPLDRVAAKASLSRPWVFGLALAGALLLGVVSTAIYYSVRYRNESTQLSTSDISAAVAGATETKSPKEPETPDSGSSARDSSATEQKQVLSTTSPVEITDGITRKRTARFAARYGGTSTLRRPSGGRATKEETDAQKRETRFRKEKNQSADGLLRIREIFEGAPKP